MVMDMDQEELDRRMDWGLFPRDIICALQELHTYMETDDAKYLIGLEEELKSMLKVLDGRDDMDDIKMIIRGEIADLELRDYYLTIDKCGELQGTLEGLHARILYETHPAIIDPLSTRVEAGPCPKCGTNLPGDTIEGRIKAIRNCKH